MCNTDSNRISTVNRPNALERSELNVIQITDVDALLPGHEPPETGGDIEVRCVNYHKIRDQIREQRNVDWPRLSPEASQVSALKVYSACRDAAAYNIMGPRLTIPTCNNMDAWERCATGHQDDHWILECIKMGFPMQYHGPPLNMPYTSNHPSAVNFDTHVTSYIELEMELGAIIGPFSSPPFTPWCNIAPLMTREKTNKVDRRVIVDLSYPPDKGPNTYVTKNEVFGQLVTHTLPTIQDVIKVIVALDFNVVLGSVDISRAYRNFRLEPLDWPLTCIHHEDKYYIDIAMPFGSRLSSVYMQNMARFIQRALLRKGLLTIIYLDDILTICKRSEDPRMSFKEVYSLISDLGLPIALDKVVHPTRVIRFLGIMIDLNEREIRIPGDKISAFLELARDTKDKKYVSVRCIQSIAGHINHIGKAVRPARCFMNRILEVLRDAQGSPVRVDHRLRADLSWFIRFLREYNGRTLIIDPTPTLFIEVDSCLIGGGGRLGGLCYAIRYPSDVAEDMHISQLEALNCVIAAKVFLRSVRDACVCIICDNQGAVATLSSGKGRDPVITAIARMFWYLSARQNIMFKFKHAPGCSMIVADALSRQFLSDIDYELAQGVVESHCLEYVEVPSGVCDYQDFL